ncbi:hypothetical protein M426DRAFT_64796 [Hypoxylon sp. CI-4A]|nr:hypothetical protein M426DRAFT_64796 [Hypoxylon sp. CI-4A]
MSSSNPIVIKAYERSSGYGWAYRQRDGDQIIEYNSDKRGFINKVIGAFLPDGYPNTVTRDYKAYQTYDSLQAFFSTIGGLLSSRAVLQGFGVGDSASSATAAALLTVLQESTGRIATILFAHRFGRAFQSETKFYRFFADIVNDAALALDILSPTLHPYLKALALCTAGVLRAICGVSGGAAKAELSAHFARDNNLAELNAKDSSQETLISLLGMLVGSVLLKVVTEKRGVYTWVIGLISLHLWTNYQAVRSVEMTTLNKQRLCILLDHMNSTSNPTPLKPHQVAAKENILNWRGPNISFADKLPEPDEIPTEDLEKFAGKMYVIVSEGGAKKIYVKATSLDRTGPYASLGIAAWAHAYAGKDWVGEDIRELEKAGWNVNVNALETGPCIRIVVDN